MDGTHGYSTAFASATKVLGKGNDYILFPTLDFNTVGASNSYVSNGSKRKHTDVDRPIIFKDGSSLVLGLGPSSSLCTTLCSGKELEEESSIDLGLSINLSARGNMQSNPINVLARKSNAFEKKKPNLDLQLSLSTGPNESELTSATHEFVPYSESPCLGSTVQLVDEGSISSRWKNGPLLSPFKTVEIPIPYQDPDLSSRDTSARDISSTAVTTPTSSQGVVRKIKVKTCRFEGCTRGARGASGLCIAHGGGRRCQRNGCNKGAEGKTVLCKAHGGGRRCEHLGCTKSAEGRTDYCIGHGGGRRCNHDGCIRAARGKSGLCIRHGGGKRCQMENCTKSAEGITGLCISHGGGRRCQYPECTKGAQGSTMFCKAHGGGRRCTFVGCTKGAEGSTPFCKGHGGGKRCTFEGCTKSVHGGTLFCVSHGGGKRCAIQECTKSARGRTNYCVRHGGGKRCKFEGCTKSAQGSTDFCKAHGGGKRCSWGQVGPEFGFSGIVPCDKFARGKSGLCAAHNAQVNGKHVSESTTQDPESSLSTQMKGIFGNNLSYFASSNDGGTSSMGYGQQRVSMPIPPPGSFVVGNVLLDNLSLPEGRVHGGGLMALLRGDATTGTSNNNNRGSSGRLEPGNVPHTWV